MQDLAELLRFLEGHSDRFLFDTAFDLNDQPAAQRLFEGVRAGQYASDADAASDVFPGASADPARYLEVRSVLRERLSRAIERFVLHLEQQADSQQVHIECQKLWLNIRTLSGCNAAELALPLAAHLLRIAEKFDLTLLCMDISLYLRLQNCLRDHVGAACADADSKYHYYRQVYEAEFVAEKSYTDLLALQVSGNLELAAFSDLAQKHLETLLPLLRQYSSGKLHLYGNLVAILQLTAAQHHADALRQCEMAIQHFKEHPYQARDALQVFYYQMLLCCIYLRDAQTGALAAQACLEFSNKKTLNYLKIKELYMLLLLHTNQLATAVAEFCQLISDPQFAFFPFGFKLGCMAYRPYLKFLTGVEINHASLDSMDAEMEGWAEVYGHQGLQTAQKVATFLLALREGRYEDIRVLAVDLENYARTQLEEPGTWRSRLFLLLLVQIPAGNFRPDEILPLAAPFLAQLRTAPMLLANQTQELEVVPFEDLWELAFGLLR